MNKGAPKDEEAESDEETEEDEKPKKKSAPAASSDEPAWKAKLAEQLPFLAKFLGGKKSNPDATDPGVKAASEDATDPGIKVPTAEDKKKKIIRIVLILGVLYFGYDTLMNTEEPTETPPATDEAAPKKPSAKKLAREKAKAEAAAKAKAEAEAAAAAAAAGAEGAGPEATPPADVPVADTSTPTPTPTPDTPVSDPATTAPPTTGDINLDIEGDTPSDASAPVEGTAAPETPVVESVPNLDDVLSQTEEKPVETPVETPTGEAGVNDQVTETPTTPTPTPGAEGDMTDQILQDLEKQIGDNKTDVPAGATYIEPPDYGNPGRGLVYNCKGKHWACVDGPSYKICEQNMSALKGEGKPKECYPDSVYQTESACAWVQRQKISANTKTDFCL